MHRPHPRKTQESSLCPQFVFGGEGTIWMSLIILSIGISFHRMGPSFDRSRFGSPLMLVGLTFLVLLPDGLTEAGAELHDSILKFASIATPFVIGAILILRNSPTYGELRVTGLVFGWLFVIASWAILFIGNKTFSVLTMARGLLAISGVLAGLIAVIFGSYLVERSSGLRNESEPLSGEEGNLVRTILERRLGRH